MRITLPDDVKYIIGKLNDSGYTAHAVGGCVRDSLLGRQPKDWDIATNALPAQMSAVFKGQQLIPTGIKHGTMTLVRRKQRYEITTYRIDGEYLDGRRPDSVSFTAELRDDLSRRDFTINAMAWNDEDGLTDYFGGRDDLAAKLIRCVGNASERFSEDYLRMLRAYRFACVLNFRLDQEIVDFVSANTEKIDMLSAERVREELEKTLTSSNTCGMIKFLEMFSGRILPIAINDKSKDVLSRTPADMEMRLCALLFQVPWDMAAEALKKLRFDNRTIDRVSKIIRYQDLSAYDTKAGLCRLVNRTDALLAESILRFDLIKEDSPEGQKRLEFLHEIQAERRPCKLGDLAMNGNELMDAIPGLNGKQVGMLLNRLLEAVMDKPELNEKNTLLELARQA